MLNKKIKLSIALSACLMLSGLASVTMAQSAQDQSASQSKLMQLLAKAKASGAVRQSNTVTQPSQSGFSKTSDINMAASTGVQANTQTPLPDIEGQSISDQSFADMVRNLMPLTPNQIKTLKKIYEQSRKAASQPAGTPPKPTSSSMVVNLSPGASPPVIRLSSGFITSLVFLDSTGQPWPIAAYDIGDPKSYNVNFNGKGNTLLVQALTQYKSGNLAIILKGLNTPVMVTLLPGQSAVDYRVDMRLPGLGPNAVVASSGMPSASSPQLLNFLDGVPPEGAKQVQVSGGACSAWIYKKHLYLRTRLMVMSPGWISKMNSADNMHVYQMPQTPIILASDHGKMIKLTVEGA